MFRRRSEISFGDRVTIRGSRLKPLRMVIGGLLIAGLSLLWQGETFGACRMGAWGFVALGVIVAGIALPAVLWPSSVVMDPNGLRVLSRREERFWAWRDVSGFKVAYRQGLSFVVRDPQTGDRGVLVLKNWYELGADRMAEAASRARNLWGGVLPELEPPAIGRRDQIILALMAVAAIVLVGWLLTTSAFETCRAGRPSQTGDLSWTSSSPTSAP